MSNALLIIGFVGVGIHTVADWQLPRIKYMRRGGLRFLRIGRLQFSYCLCKESI